jgi:hypothetical protein
LLDESIDMLLTVAEISTLNEVLELAGPEATSRVGQLEGPQEVADLLEVGANGVKLVNKILDTDNTELAQALLNDCIVSERNTLLVAARMLV